MTQQKAYRWFVMITVIITLLAAAQLYVRLRNG